MTFMLRRAWQRLPLAVFLAVAATSTAVLGTAASSMLSVRIPGVDARQLVEGFQVVRGTNYPWSYPQVSEFIERAQGWTPTAVANWPGTLVMPRRSEFVYLEAVTSNYDDVIGVAPIEGRWFADTEDDAPGREAVLLLSEGLCRRGFGSVRECLGSEVTLGTGKYTVIGVMPAGFRGVNRRAEAWAPITMVAEWMPERKGYALLRMEGVTFVQLVGRRSGPVEMVTRDLTRLAREFVTRRNQGASAIPEDRWPTYRAFDLQESQTDPAAIRAGRILRWALGVLLAMCAVNVTLHLVSRFRRESRWYALRVALGATKARLIRSQAADWLFVSIAAAVLSFAFGSVALQGVRVMNYGFETLQLSGIAIPLEDLQASVLRAVLLSAALGAFLFFIAASMAVSWGRLAPGSLTSQTAAIGGSRRARTIERGIVAIQIAGTVFLGTWAAMLSISYRNTLEVPYGFDPHGALFLRHGMEASAGIANIRDVIASTGSVHVFGAVSCLPLSRACGSANVRPHLSEVAGGASESFGAVLNHIEPGAGEALGLTVIRGRWFVPADVGRSDDVVVVSEAAAALLTPGEPLGRIVRVGAAASRPKTIIGVVRDVKYNSLLEPVRPTVYLPSSGLTPQTGVLVVRVLADPQAVSASLIASLRTLNIYPGPGDLAPLRRIVQEGQVQQRLQMGIFVAFFGIALVVTISGVIGITALTIRRSTAEIGLRIALGGTPSSEMRRLSGNLLGYLGLGAIAGIVLLMANANVIKPLLVGVAPADPWILAVALLAAIGIGTLTVTLLTFRGAQVDPAPNLRVD